MNKLFVKAKHILVGRNLETLDQAALVIEGGKVTWIGLQSEAEAQNLGVECETLNCGEATLMPGLIDAHMHTFGLPSTALDSLFTGREAPRALRAAGELSEMLAAGYTAARCLGSSIGIDLARAIEEEQICGPRLIVAGEFISTSHGTWGGEPKENLPKGRPCALADGPKEMRGRVRDRIREGAHFIKLGLSKGQPDDVNKAWGDDPYGQALSMSDEELAAAVQEAHSHGLKVSVHAIGEEAVAQALRNGVDIIEHGYAISEQTRQRLAETQTPVVTTLSQIYYHRQAYDAFNYSSADRLSFDRHWHAMHEGLQEGLKAGISFVLGTDLIGRPTHPLAAAAKEFELVVAAGMPVRQALQAGTVFAADLLGIAEETGCLKEGWDADIIAVRHNPLEDITVLQNPSVVLKRGQFVQR